MRVDEAERPELVLGRRGERMITVGLGDDVFADLAVQPGDEKEASRDAGVVLLNPEVHVGPRCGQSRTARAGQGVTKESGVLEESGAA